MDFKLLIISKLYPEYLKAYYAKNKEISNENYEAQYGHLLNDASEFISSYTKTLKKIGANVSCVISNASPLQKKWLLEKTEISNCTDKEIILKQIEYYQPNALWVENIKYVEKGFIEQIRKQYPEIKLIFSYHCAPYKDEDMENFKSLDFMLTCTPGFKQYYEDEEVKAYLIYHAFDAELLKKIRQNISPKNQLLFTGSLFLGENFHNERTELVEKIIKNDIPITIYGNLENKRRIVIKKGLYYINRFIKYLNIDKLFGKSAFIQKVTSYSSSRKPSYSKKLVQSTKEPVFGIEMLQTINDSNIVLNKHISRAGEYAGNMRLFETTGIGTCLLTDNKKNMPDLFEINKEVVVYENEEDCIKKIEWLINNPEICKEIALAGQKKTLTNHTVESRCRQIVEIIEQELNTKWAN